MLIELEREQMLGNEPEAVILDNSWVAGGAIRRWFVGDKQCSDIDMFFTDELQLQIYASGQMKDWNVLYDNNNAITYIKDKTVIQLIKKYYMDAESCINSFDYTICQFAYNGKKIYATTEAIITSLRKHLAVNNIQKGYELDSLRRAFKYFEQGYKPCMGTLRDLVSAFRAVTEDDMKKQVEMSPGGGIRHIRWD